MKIFTAIIEKCPDTGLYVSYVPGFAGAHTQAESLDELQKNLREAIKLLICNAGVRNLDFAVKLRFDTPAFHGAHI